MSTKIGFIGILPLKKLAERLHNFRHLARSIRAEPFFPNLAQRTRVSIMK